MQKDRHFLWKLLPKVWEMCIKSQTGSNMSIQKGPIKKSIQKGWVLRIGNGSVKKIGNEFFQVNLLSYKISTID